MRKTGIYWIVGIVLFLGLFFQYNRMDGFLHLFTVGNTRMNSEPNSGEPWKGADEVMPDTYLIVYDPSSVESMFLRHETERMITEKKMKFQSVRNDTPIANGLNGIRGVLLVTGDLSRVVSLPTIFSYVEQGGTAVLLTRLQQNSDMPTSQDIVSTLGISQLDAESQSFTAQGLTMQTDFLPGSKGVQVAGDIHYNTFVDSLTLLDSAVVHVSDYTGTVPLIWQQAYGKGMFYVYNGTMRPDKTNRGFLMSFFCPLW